MPSFIYLPVIFLIYFSNINFLCCHSGLVKVFSLSFIQFQVLILSRIVPHCSSNLLPMCMRNSPEVNSCFMSSNIYSNSERILLNWMNTNYENTRHIIWKDCEKGEFFSFKQIISNCSVTV